MSEAASGFAAWLRGLQDEITTQVAAIDGGTFLADAWTKAADEPLQGEGITRILEDGAVFERAGCGFSHVRGPRLPPSATQHRPQLAGAPFEAMGVSLVFHPRNPYAPTVHMNVRMISAGHPGEEAVCWFGGGMDLTPIYGFDEDAQHFHTTCRDALAPFGDDKYARFKPWCDEYFYLKHRQEARGIGGVFFDDFSEGGQASAMAMTQAVGSAFLSAYLPILMRRKDTPYGERERAFQLYRRGRYVEFNLVWDRGTHFGLQSGGRTESILLSMPPLAAWSYQHQPEPGSDEARLAAHFPGATRLGLNREGVLRVGVYGGAFDPPHVTHVVLAQAAVQQLRLDALHILPTGQAWHRAQQTSAAEHRLAMAQRAFAEVPGAVVDPREIEREGPSYTVDSLRELQTLYPRALLHLIIGADQARALDQWHAWQDIVAMAVLVIAARIDADEPLEPAAPPGARYHYLQLAPVDTSATDIRQRVASGQGIAHLVPDAVARYIAQHHLYHTAR